MLPSFLLDTSTFISIASKGNKDGIEFKRNLPQPLLSGKVYIDAYRTFLENIDTKRKAGFNRFVNVVSQKLYGNPYELANDFDKIALDDHESTMVLILLIQYYFTM